MRIDYEYLSNILEFFLNSKLPTVDWDSFKKLHEVDEHKFVFHIKLMHDKELIVGNINKNELGINQDFNSEEYYISIIPWRLTLDGHDFANILAKPNILATIKDKFKDEGLSAVIGISKKIAEKQALKLLDNL